MVLLFVDALLLCEIVKPRDKSASSLWLENVFSFSCLICGLTTSIGCSHINGCPIRNSSDQQFSVAMADSEVLTLANICLDVQIGICMFLHPSDILALRKVCQHWKFSLFKISEVLLSRLVKLLNLLHGDGWFGWLRFIEYALTTRFSFQVSPYPT